MQRACENTQPARPTRKRENTRVENIERIHFFWTLSAHPKTSAEKLQMEEACSKCLVIKWNKNRCKI